MIAYPGAEMAQILVRNIEAQLKTRLERLAKRNGRSMEAEVREILRDSLKEESTPQRGLGSEMAALFSGQGIGLKDGEEVPEVRGMRMQIPTFDE
jgi:plasmid stability protein